MIVPSIDLMNGQAVQLIQGRDLSIEAGPPEPWARRFGRVGEIAVIDLDAALGRGSNRAAIESLVRIARCRVGGGLRNARDAREVLDLGASSVILGTAATPEVLRELPRDRVYAALDTRDDEIVVEGWTQGTGRSALERIHELRPYVKGFLVTFVEKEGGMGGIDLERVAPLKEAARECAFTVAGGITTPEEVAELDRMGVDAQIGMALYSEELDLADAFAAPLTSDRADGLWPTVVVDEHNQALGLAWSDADSLKLALAEGRGIYHSRKRGLWRKGDTSGSTQELLQVAVDCDRDTLRFQVRQDGGGFCHEDVWTCWGNETGWPALYRRLNERQYENPTGSYTERLLEDSRFLEGKLIEEARELAEADNHPDIVHEAADLLYFATVALVRGGVSPAEVEAELNRRALRVSRRPGNLKPDRENPS